MASPLSKIDHAPKAVKEALRDNCWATLLRRAGESTGMRLNNARTQKGVFQVQGRACRRWHAVQPADTLYQA